MGNITSADVAFTLWQPILFPTPQQLQGFDTDDIYGVEALQSGEVKMGVDGILSAGFVYQPVKQMIHLQVDSASNRFFETLNAQEQAAQTKYVLYGLIVAPAIATKFAHTQGYMTQYSPIPAGKRVLQARQYEITWARIVPAPVG